MFSRNELIRNSRSPGDDDDLPLMEVAEFHLSHLHCIAHCGDKEHFTSAMVFWLWSLQLVDRPTAKEFVRFAEEALCDPIDAETYFQQMDAFAAHVKKRVPTFLRRHNAFVSGLVIFEEAMLGDRYAGSVLVEFADDYVAFHSRVEE